MSDLSFIEQVDIIARKNGYKLKEAYKGEWESNIYCYYNKINKDWYVWVVQRNCNDKVADFKFWNKSNNAEKEHIIDIWIEK